MNFVNFTYFFATYDWLRLPTQRGRVDGSACAARPSQNRACAIYAYGPSSQFSAQFFV